VPSKTDRVIAQNDIRFFNMDRHGLPVANNDGDVFGAFVDVYSTMDAAVYQDLMQNSTYPFTSAQVVSKVKNSRTGSAQQVSVGEDDES
jgi:hypothetical protein